MTVITMKIAVPRPHPSFPRRACPRVGGGGNPSPALGLRPTSERRAAPFSSLLGGLRKAIVILAQAAIQEWAPGYEHNASLPRVLPAKAVYRIGENDAGSSILFSCLSGGRNPGAGQMPAARASARIRIRSSRLRYAHMWT